MGIYPAMQKDRAVDILLISDASNQDDHLRRCEVWAKQNGLAFPSLEKPFLKKTNSSLYMEKGCPVVIYCRTPATESTFKFQYKSEEFDRLYNSSFENAKEVSLLLKLAIQKYKEFK